MKNVLLFACLNLALLSSVHAMEKPEEGEGNCSIHVHFPKTDNAPKQVKFTLWGSNCAIILNQTDAQPTRVPVEYPTGISLEALPGGQVGWFKAVGQTEVEIKLLSEDRKGYTAETTARYNPELPKDHFSIVQLEVPEDDAEAELIVKSPARVRENYTIDSSPLAFISGPTTFTAKTKFSHALDALELLKKESSYPVISCLTTAKGWIPGLSNCILLPNYAYEIDFAETDEDWRLQLKENGPSGEFYGKQIMEKYPSVFFMFRYYLDRPKG